MTMSDGGTEIDRLIEQGLSLYGEGDLDGALLVWERVLMMDPGNAQANSYVDYVRMNYELLSTDRDTEDSGPYAIDSDEPEYQIEIVPGEGGVLTAAPPLSIDAGDEGWVINGERRQKRPSSESLELQLLVDDPATPADAPFDSKTGEGMGFEDATREYQGGAGRPAFQLLATAGGPTAAPEFAGEATPGFGSGGDVHTPVGFGSEPTDVRRRDLGFVQPSEAAHRAAPTTPERPELPELPELKITLRTPGPGGDAPPRAPAAARVVTDRGPATPPAPPPRAPVGTGAPAARASSGAPGAPEGTAGEEPALELDSPPASSFEIELPPAGAAPAFGSLELELEGASDAQARELLARAETRPLGGAGDAADLIASLPVPRPPSATPRPLTGKTRPPATDPMSSDHRVTRDLEPAAPAAPAAPAPPAAPPPLGLATAPTQELPYTMRLDSLRAIKPPAYPATAPTRELSEQERVSPAVGAPPTVRDPIVAAPTRELGLRNLRRPATEDETTGEVDVHKIRAARASASPVVPGIDPIDARSAEILEQVERNAPAGEAREDRTRRRITALLERATEWSNASDLEGAVIAVDLALSEDPNSALAQKLVHRNRETIMSAFQSYLGDLERTPALARPLHELGSAPISPRAAFLLSRIDGTLSLDEILDVSGMPRMEAYRYLCQLFLRGILR